MICTTLTDATSINTTDLLSLSTSGIISIVKGKQLTRNKEENSDLKKQTTSVNPPLRRSARIAALAAKKNTKLILSTTPKVGKRKTCETKIKVNTKKRRTVKDSVPCHAYNLRSSTEELLNATVTVKQEPKLSYSSIHIDDKSNCTNAVSSISANNNINADDISRLLSSTVITANSRLSTASNSQFTNVVNINNSNNILFSISNSEDDFSVIAGAQEEPFSPARVWFEEQAVFIEGLPSPDASWNGIWD
ncbi:MAG: hypothetical protein EXX96DRAFT_561326 [Benjaminiella poitrasii]|nr:MAG: hypothetical protein EXX96DRAFT_561326 [Benjaminiella poitrasii]